MSKKPFAACRDGRHDECLPWDARGRPIKPKCGCPCHKPQSRWSESRPQVRLDVGGLVPRQRAKRGQT